MVTSTYGKSRKVMYTIQNAQVVMERNPKLVEIITSCPKCDHMEVSFFPKLICPKCLHYSTKIVGSQTKEFVSLEEFEKAFNQGLVSDGLSK